MTAKINNRITIHQGKVFELIRENVTLENGATTDVEYIEHPGAAAVIPFLDDSRIVLLRQYRHALKTHIWEIPAGTLDPREEIIDCAKRELIEETGYSASGWQKLGEITPVPGYSDERVHIFMATGLTAAPQNLDEDEILDVHPIDFRAAIDMIHRGEIRDAKTISGLLLAHHRRGG